MVVRVVRERITRKEVGVGFLASRAIARNKSLAGSGVLAPEHVVNENQTIITPVHEHEIGQLVEGKGIYVGIWRPVDREGHKLNGEFNLFAAPQDTCYLTNTKSGKLATYDDDIQRIAGLQDICGHDGTMLANDTAIYEAVRVGDHAALAKWHMPARELVDGRNVDDNKIQEDNLYAHKDKGALRGTFANKAGSGHNLYWTASEFCNSEYVCAVYFMDEGKYWTSKNIHCLSSRPVRAELRPAV